MDLSFLFPSKVRREVLQFFLLHEEEPVHVQGLARLLEIAPQQIHKELVNLENLGLLLSRKQGNQRLFNVNKRFYFYGPLKDLFAKWQEVSQKPGEVYQTFQFKDLRKKYKAQKVPPTILENLEKSSRKKPRAYTEEKLMKQKGLLLS